MANSFQIHVISILHSKHFRRLQVRLKNLGVDLVLVWESTVTVGVQACIYQRALENKIMDYHGLVFFVQIQQRWQQRCLSSYYQYICFLTMLDYTDYYCIPLPWCKRIKVTILSILQSFSSFSFIYIYIAIFPWQFLLLSHFLLFRGVSEFAHGCLIPV